MSVGYLSYVSCCAPVAKAPKAVLSSLADFANEDGVAWPSVATTALHSGWSERAVQDALRGLERDGLIEPVPGYVYQRRKANATVMPYRVLVTLCRWECAPPPDTVWEKHCRHQGRKGRRPRTPSAGTGPDVGAQTPHPSTESEGVQVSPHRGADAAQRDAGSAPEPPMELPANDGSPSQVTVTSARDATTLRGVGPDDVACAACDTHHPRGRHLVPAPAPSDWRSRTVSEHDEGGYDVPPPVGDDLDLPADPNRPLEPGVVVGEVIEVDDDLPWRDEPFPELDETEETSG